MHYAAHKELLVVCWTCRPVEQAEAGMKLKRSMFAFNFGRQQIKKVDVDREQVLQARRYITERSVDPVEVAKKKARKQQHS